MDIFIHINKKKLDNNCKLAIEEYSKRISPFCKIKHIFYKDISKISFQNNSYIINVTPGKETISSPDLAKLINDVTVSGISCLEFIIDPDNEKNEENNKIKNLSFSSFESSPDITVVFVTEQLYRAFTILNNITYHK